MDLKATRSPMIYPVIMLALHSTLRDAEMKTLTWKQIDWLKQIPTVGQSKTKAGTGRTIPINSDLFAALNEYRE